MADLTLYSYQKDALKRMKNGCILCGSVGSGKSRTALSYYFFKECGGEIDPYDGYIPMSDPKDIYIITTARKRDTKEWEMELSPFLLSTNPEVSLYGNDVKVVVDSWNNIKKYSDVKDSFFIFDEQRVVGYGVWSKSFIKIAKSNHWVLLSATPGDTWMDYIPVFIANGFYKNKSEFVREHVIYKNNRYYQVDHYVGVKKLERLRNDILVTMDYRHPATPRHQYVYSSYDIPLYKSVGRLRWDPYKNEPIESPSALCFAWRRVVSEDESRRKIVLELTHRHPKVVIFYNYNYELDILKNLTYEDGTVIAEWNGSKHERIPETERWVYLVQYSAGAEGWNCTETNAMIFYSPNYSYKIMMQAAGRIDRLNTPFKELYYYHLRSKAPIDIGIARALSQKKTFNESVFVKW